MHEFLKSVGLSSYKTKKQIRSLVDWVLEKPDHLNILTLEGDANLSVAERELPGKAGISVVGEIDEGGTFVPEYYFPELISREISSDAVISYKKETARDGYIGMCEDYRFGMAMIFNVRNIPDIVKNEQAGLLSDAFKKVAFSALCSDATILLPLYQPQMVLQQGKDALEKHTRLLEDAHAGNPEAIESLASEDLKKYQNIMMRLRDTDVYSLVESFMIPYGMESNQYYFLGKILSVEKHINPLTAEGYYRMMSEVNGVTFPLAVNAEDLTGMPYEGARIRAHAWMMGELLK